MDCFRPGFGAFMGWLTRRQYGNLSRLLLGVGLVVRLGQYLHNRSLWRDEAAIALGILDSSWSQILGPLPHNQAAPPGFVAIEKLIVILFGTGEYALRLWPFLAGCGALLLFYPLAQRYLSGIAVPIAIALFSTGYYTVYYSNEVKQYGPDLLISLGLTWLLLPAPEHRSPHASPAQPWQASLGAIAIWVSHPSIFVLAGMEALRLGQFPWWRWGGVLRSRWGIYGVWLVSFGVLYAFHLNTSMANPDLQESWGDRYPSSPLDILWLLDALGRYMHRPLGYRGIPEVLALIAWAVGLVAAGRQAWLQRKSQNQSHSSLFWLWLCPVGMTLVATYAHKYPFRDRLVLYLLPFFGLVVAEGVALLLRWSWQSAQAGRSQPGLRRLGGWIALGLSGLLSLGVVGQPLLQSTQWLVQPKVTKEVRPVLEQFERQRQPSQPWIVDGGGGLVWEYYARRFGYQPMEYEQMDLRDEAVQVKLVQRFRGLSPAQSQVWLLGTNADEFTQDWFKQRFDRLGKRLATIERNDAFAYRYDFR